MRGRCWRLENVCRCGGVEEWRDWSGLPGLYRPEVSGSSQSTVHSAVITRTPDTPLHLSSPLSSARPPTTVSSVHVIVISIWSGYWYLENTTNILRMLSGAWEVYHVQEKWNVFVFSLTKLESNKENICRLEAQNFSLLCLLQLTRSLRVSKPIFSREFFVSNFSDNFYWHESLAVQRSMSWS